MTKPDITVYNGVDEKGKPKGVAVLYKNELIQLEKQQDEKKDFRQLFGKFCENADYFTAGEQEKMKI